MFIDANEIEKNTQISADVCVIGAGAAGITLARELIGESFDVCLLESGGLELDIETQMLYSGILRGVHYLPLEAGRLRYFGGTTNHWGGASRPLDPIDFERRDWVPESGWPFDRTHLEPYYRRAQPVLELGPFAYGIEEWKGAELHRPAPFDDRVLRNAFLQKSPPTRFGKVYRGELKRAPNIRTYLHANVLEIETTANGNAVRRLRVSALARNDFFVTARQYVIATGGIENARLLLLSDRVNPRGVGNTNGLVGRFFMEHPNFHPGKAATLLPLRFPSRFYNIRTRVTHPAFPDAPVDLWGFITPSEETLRRRGLLNFGIAPIPVPEPTAEGVASVRIFKRALLGKRDWPEDFWEHVGNVIADIDDIAVHGYRKITGQEQPIKLFDVGYWTEQRPNPESRVYLSDERDALGQRRIVFDWRLTEQDRETMRAALRLFAQELGKAGLGRLRIEPAALGANPESLLQPSFHHMGTTRMHADPKRGVVDRNCRMHEVSNLSIAGSSVFPTVGHANPTITIAALAIRLADHIKGMMKKVPEVAEVRKEPAVAEVKQ